MEETERLAYSIRLSPEGFLRSLSLVPWFSRLGEPSSRDHLVARIHNWDEWPGPESAAVEDLGQRSQVWYDELIDAAGPRKSEVQTLWGRIQDVVIEHARGAVPYRRDEDAWHGPTAAVWDAAWVAATIGCSLLLDREAPSEALDQWRWLTEGHWPCGYASLPVEGDPVRLMVL
jgi:hypothetical protein